MNLTNFIGIPYSPRGNPPYSADCWTLVRGYAESVLDRHYPDYFYDVDGFQAQGTRHLITVIRDPGKCWQKVDTPKHGDVAIMRIAGHPTHCAIYVGLIDGHDSLLHTLEGRMSCVEPVSVYKDNIIGWYRHAA